MPNQEPASAWILEIARWESVPRGSFALTWKLSSRLFSWPDWLPLGLRGWAYSKLTATLPFLCASISLAEIAKEILTWSEAWRGNYHKEKKFKKLCHFGIRCMYLFVFLLTMRVCWVFQNEWLSMLLSAVVTVESRLTATSVLWSPQYYGQ